MIREELRKHQLKKKQAEGSSAGTTPMPLLRPGGGGAAAIAAAASVQPPVETPTPPKEEAANTKTTWDLLDQKRYDQKTEEARKRLSKWLDHARALATVSNDSDFDELLPCMYETFVHNRALLDVTKETQTLCDIYYWDLCNSTLRPRLLEEEARIQRQLQKLTLMRRFADPHLEEQVRKQLFVVRTLLGDMLFPVHK